MSREPRQRARTRSPPPPARSSDVVFRRTRAGLIGALDDDRLLLSLVLAATPAPRFGVLDFPVTGNTECRRLFVTGMLQLHSFQYDDAHETFQAAEKADPRCAMALWGDAMAYSHPIWGEEQVQSAQAALAQVKNDGDAEAQRARAPRRRAGALRHRRHQRAPPGLAPGDRARAPRLPRRRRARPPARARADRQQRGLPNTGRLMQATAIAMHVFQRKPNHPGAAHYFIHACDTPDHAVLALPAARKYARIAPASSHARHMPSHIFVQLGMWADSAASNEDSWAASEQWATPAEAGPGRSRLPHLLLARRLVPGARAVLPGPCRPGRHRPPDEGGGRRGHPSRLRRARPQVPRRHRPLVGGTRSLLAPIEKPYLETGEAEDSLGCALPQPG